MSTHDIAELRLSTRTRQALLNNGIGTVESMLNLTETEIKDLVGVGYRSAEEIKHWQTKLKGEWKQFKVILVGSASVGLEIALNDGWTINRVDHSGESLVYILSKDKEDPKFKGLGYLS